VTYWTDAPGFDPANPYRADLDGHRALDRVHGVFRRWLGPAYDLQALDVVLSSAAVQQLTGDPVWTLVISGAGNAKTETVAPLAGAGAMVESAIASEGALLSATSEKERATDATGGLLRRIGPAGTLVLKDFTTILSMNRDMRAAVLAALREIYDGRWTRNVGTDGGRTLEWAGRLTLIGATTTAYDTHHGVIASMGDRFALVRTDSATNRHATGLQALNTVGREQDMRRELAAAVGTVLSDVNTDVQAPEWMLEPLLAAADLVTLARTAVERDYKGEVIDGNAPEAPTRFAKMLLQLVRGHLALGGTEAEALNVALRVAHDSVPPRRLELMRTVEQNPGRTYTALARLTGIPRSTARREMDALQMLGLVCIDTEEWANRNGEEGQKWLYTLAADYSVTALDQRDSGSGP
jgi:DNA-binding transcriptional ArsR family regulator